MIIAITGGTGLIGSRLSHFLRQSGHSIRLISRQATDASRGIYHWDPAAHTMDMEALRGIDALVHLAGESISIPWNTANKKRIVDSRIQGGETLRRALNRENLQIPSILTASAIGWYPSDPSTLLTEDLPSGHGFLAETTRAWEEANEPLALHTGHFVTLRIGLVLSGKGGLLQPLLPLYNLGAGAPLGNGKHWMAWIDLDDLCRMMVYALENRIPSGTYNAVAPNPVQNRTFSETLARVLKRPHLLPPVPTAVLKLMLGERHQLVLMSQRASAEKILDTGFTFEYPTLEESLRHQL